MRASHVGGTPTYLPSAQPPSADFAPVASGCPLRLYKPSASVSDAFTRVERKLGGFLRQARWVRYARVLNGAITHLAGRIVKETSTNTSTTAQPTKIG